MREFDFSGFSLQFNLPIELSDHFSHRMENSVLGNALEGVPEEEEDEEKVSKDSPDDSSENVDGRKCSNLQSAS